MGIPVIAGALALALLLSVLLIWQRTAAPRRLASTTLQKRAISPRRGWLWSLVGAAAGAALFATTAWLVGDVLKVFGDFVLSLGIVMWVAVGGAFVGLAVGAVAVPGKKRRWWHVLTAAVLVVVSASTAGLGVNREVGYFVSPNQILTMFTTTNLPAMPKLHTANAVALSPHWTPPAGAPTRGELVQVDIPAKISGFEARPAIVYLPPAALTSAPPRLPLLVTFSGQPGSPQDIFNSGHLAEIAEGYQKTHGGIAPIIVSPDQLGTPQANPMCSDSAFGKNETYLMKDVIPWIRATLPVAQDAAHTAFMGFSQGGTCTVQLGFGHPDVVDTLIPISPQLEPTIGSKTIARAFDGDQAAFTTNTPLARLSAQGNYPHMTAAFYVGGDDAKYSAWANTLVDAARKHGVDATLTYSPGTGHNWHTASFAMKDSFPFIVSHLGLPQ